MLERSTIDRALRVIAVLAVVACIVALAGPLWHRGLPTGHDAAAHVTYTHAFDRALHQGQRPVRWVRLGDGDTQPLFNFYQPGFYYMVGLAHVLVPSLAAALKVTVLASWWLGAVGMYALTRRLGGLAGATAALLFASSPYVLLDVFVRAAYPELMAISCAAVLLALVDAYARGGGHGSAVAIAVLTGVMLVCHLPASLLCGGAIAGHACVVVPRGPIGRRRLGGLVLAAVAGLGLGAFYVIPALLELPHVRMSALTSGYFDYRRHFVDPSQWVTYTWGHGGSVEGPDDDMSFQVGIAQWIVLASGIGLVLAARGRGRACAGRLALFWLIVAAVSLLAMTTASLAAWALLPPLRYVQFPWRFLMLTTLAASVVGAFVIQAVPRATVRAAAVVGMCALQGWLCLPLTVPIGYVGTDAHSAALNAPPGATRRPFVEAGYFPLTSPPRALGTAGLWTVIAGAATVRPVRVTDTAPVLDVVTPSGARLALHVRAFPGWSVRLDGEPLAPSVDPSTGFLVVDVPAGSHRLEAEFADTRPRQWGNGISAATGAALVAWLGVAIVRRTPWRRRTASPA
jgi:hypothetical protein